MHDSTHLRHFPVSHNLCDPLARTPRPPFQADDLGDLAVGAKGDQRRDEGRKGTWTVDVGVMRVMSQPSKGCPVWRSLGSVG